MRKQWECVYWLYIDQIKKDEETLYVILEKVYSIASRPKMIVVSHYGHPQKKYQKNDQERIFSINLEIKNK